MKKALKKFLVAFVGENMNVKCRDEFIGECIKELPRGSKILDAGAGQLKWKSACSHLEYVSQDFCQYDGKGDGMGLHTGDWNSDIESRKHIDIVCDIIDMPVEDKTFDTVLCSEVLEHLPKPELALKEFGRVIKDGGMLILTAPFCSMTHFAPYHFCTGFNIYWYEQMLKEYGFEILSSERNGNYFAYVKQEILRLSAMSKHYYGKRDILMLICSVLLAKRLKRYIRGGISSDFACFGYHIKAEKIL